MDFEMMEKIQTDLAIAEQPTTVAVSNELNLKTPLWLVIGAVVFSLATLSLFILKYSGVNLL